MNTTPETLNHRKLRAAFDEAFGKDPLVSLLGVTPFKAGDPLVISEPVTDQTMRAMRDLLLVKINVGPGHDGPAGAASTSPGIGIEIWLPNADEWDGRIHTIGGLGGFDGGRHGDTQAVGWFYAALTAGMEASVSASTDSGHAPTNASWAFSADGSFATQLWEDYAHRAQHEMALKTKALTAAFYGRAHSRCYYEGASTGGRHGYRLAQDYPDDYDGIIGMLPALYLAEFCIGTLLYRDLVIERDLGGVPLTEGQMDLVSNAAIRSADLVGGEHLGYILDNQACTYDPARDADVLCLADGGTNSSADAITLAQAEAIKKIWYGMTSDGSVPDPAQDNGVALELDGKHRWYGFARGTSLYNAFFTKFDPRMRELLAAAAKSGDSLGSDFAAIALQDPKMGGLGFRTAAGNGESKWRSLSYAQLNDAFDRAVSLDAQLAHVSSVKPDLSAFAARGGKFLSWHGWNDEAIPIQGTMRYYDSVIAHMGSAEAVQDFFRLYLVPGGGHMSPQGTSNPEANPPTFAYGQLYRLLVDWVENGKAPGRIDLASPSEVPVKRSQPVCPYPGKLRYIGGDPNVAASYVCA
jgi:Tannase and feruloyl esterase